MSSYHDIYREPDERALADAGAHLTEPPAR